MDPDDDAEDPTIARTRLGQCNFRSLVAQAVDRIAPVAEAQSVVIQNLSADQVITLDHRQIGSVLTNLLANALEAMPTGGSIHVSTTAGETSV